MRIVSYWVADAGEPESTIETDLGHGFWVLHRRDAKRNRPEVTLLRSSGARREVQWVFHLSSPYTTPDLHLRILSHLSWLASRPGLAAHLDVARNPAEILAILSSNEGGGGGGYSTLDTEKVFEVLGSTADGLGDEAAQVRREQSGPNVLRHRAKDPWWKVLLLNFVSVFAVLLWASGALCFLPGVDMPALGWAIFTVVIVNGAFSFAQEFRAERAVEALQKLFPAQVRVLRNGLLREVPASDLVWGDVIALEEGDLVPADARVIESIDLRVNHANLTGESRPVYKAAGPLPPDQVDDFLWTEVPNRIFAGTSVISGRARAVVTGTGMDCEIGAIARLTQQVKAELSPLQKEMKVVVNLLTVLSLSIGAVFFALGAGLAGLSWAEAFIFTIGITVANIPEGLLPTLSLSLAMGVRRLAAKKVLVKRLASVETLGSTTVICTDKTGTLTTNQVSVVDYWPEPLPTAWQVAALCNNARRGPAGALLGDPTEAALLEWAEPRMGRAAPEVAQSFPRLGQFPFESIRKRMSTVHQDFNGGLFLCAKGAPLELLARCNQFLGPEGPRLLTDQDRQDLHGIVDSMATRGLRTLALAWKTLVVAPRSCDEAESGLCFVGVCGMEDPPRPEAAAAVARCATAGIRLVMITGDYGPTAWAIAERIGMVSPNRPGRLLTGLEVERLSDRRLDETLAVDRGPLVFARMAPDQKMRIVERFQKAGEVVAVTGDGVNDAAALKRADIGIAMGASANDVAQESSDMVVLDGSFSGIVVAIEEGRAVYANIQRFVTYILASNMPELAPFVLFVLLKVPLALTVLQILAIDLGTDLVPALGLGQEPPERGLMDLPPRRRSERLVNLGVFVRAYLWLGAWEIFFSLVLFWGALSDGDPARATTMTFAAIVFCQIGNVFACRTNYQSIVTAGWMTNRLVLFGVGVELTLLITLIHVPFLAAFLDFHPLRLQDWVALSLIPPIFLGIEEARKLWLRQRALL